MGYDLDCFFVRVERCVPVFAKKGYDLDFSTEVCPPFCMSVEVCPCFVKMGYDLDCFMKLRCVPLFVRAWRCVPVL